MEQVRLTGRGSSEPPSADGVGQEGRVYEEFSRLLSLPQAADAAPGGVQPAPDGKVDWSASLNLVHRMVGTLRANAEHMRNMETRTQAVLQHAARELEGSRARISDLEARLRASERREKQAEARAREAEEWLRRIHDVVADELVTGLLGGRPDPTDPAQGATEPV